MAIRTGRTNGNRTDPRMAIRTDPRMAIRTDPRMAIRTGRRRVARPGPRLAPARVPLVTMDPESSSSRKQRSPTCPPRHLPRLMSCLSRSMSRLMSPSPEDSTDVVLIAAAEPVDGTTPGAAEPAAAPAAPAEASPDRSIEARAGSGGRVSGNAEPAAQDLPETGTGIDPRSSLGIWQLLAMVMAAASAFASWRTRVV